MSDALFTYGTLQFPEVMEAVTGLALPWVEAEAPGFAQFCFTDRIYPGMVVREGALTQGSCVYRIESPNLGALGQI